MLSPEELAAYGFGIGPGQEYSYIPRLGGGYGEAPPYISGMQGPGGAIPQSAGTNPRFRPPSGGKPMPSGGKPVPAPTSTPSRAIEPAPVYDAPGGMKFMGNATVNPKQGMPPAPNFPYAPGQPGMSGYGLGAAGVAGGSTLALALLLNEILKEKGVAQQEPPRGPSGIAPNTEPPPGSLPQPQMARGFGPMGAGGTVRNLPLPVETRGPSGIAPNTEPPPGSMPQPKAAAPAKAPARGPSGIAPPTEPPPGSMAGVTKAPPVDPEAWRQLQDAWLFDPIKAQQMAQAYGVSPAAPFQAGGAQITGG